MKAVWFCLMFAAGGFFVLFSPWTRSAVGFWPAMATLTALLAAVSLVIDRKRIRTLYRFERKDVILGLLSAAFLYAIFFVGHFLSVRMFSFASRQIASIYHLRAGISAWQAAALLFFIIGPAEEIFWRGFVQRRLCDKYGAIAGWLAASAIYASVHLWSFNLMLMVAAAVCGLFWGLVYLLSGRMWVCIISHAVWDVVIFILLPIR